MTFVLRRAIPKNNKSGRAGVFYNEKKKIWQSWIQRDNKRHYLGTFQSKDEADRAYNNAEQLLISGYML